LNNLIFNISALIFITYVSFDISVDVNFDVSFDIKELYSRVG